MKNIYITEVRGKKKYCVQVMGEDGNRKKKYFNFLIPAQRWLKAFNENKDKFDINSLSKLQIADIRTALNTLPKDMTLLECVKIAINQQKSKISLNEAKKHFLKIKEGKVSDSYYTKMKNRLSKVLETLKDWENSKSENIIEFCFKISKSPKSQKHYLNIAKEFFNFCETKEYFLNNPFKRIHTSELPKIERKYLNIPKVKDVKAFFEETEKEYPQYVGFLALVAFGGLRMSEAQQIEIENINFEEKSILLSFKKSKTGQTWLQINMPDNVWKWLEKYPPCKDWKYENVYTQIANIKKTNNIGNNALRHAFATYHLSLLRTPAETSLLMRHTNTNQLWQTYLEGLTSIENAKAYFDIVPKL